MRFFNRIIKVSGLILLQVIVFLNCTGFVCSGDIDIKHSGKGEAVFSVQSNLELNEFKKSAQEKVNGINIVSGSSDMITIKNITKTDDGFSVVASFRRIDKVKAQGEFELKKFSKYVEKGSMSRRLLENIYKSNLSCTMSMYYNNYLGQITLPKERTKQIKPYDINNNELSLDDFIKNGDNDKKSEMLMFRVLDVTNIKEIKVTLPGKIKYYGSDEKIKIENGNTFIITPFSVKAQILKNNLVVVDGVEKIEPTITTEEVGAIIGYIVYEKSASPVMIGLIVVICCVVVGLFVAFFIVMTKKGKNILSQEKNCKTNLPINKGE